MSAPSASELQPDRSRTIAAQWHEPQRRPFTRQDREATTIWLSGMTRRHDEFLCAAGRGLGYRMLPMPIPDNEALKIGKEYCNRGQCNPTYYTAGTLIRHLQKLEEDGLSREQILREHAFITAGSCGPCRFGMYATEYRKALREAGFDGFRILRLNQHNLCADALAEDEGLDINLRFIAVIIKAIVAADILNMLGYRIRPYEVHAGATEAVLQKADATVIAALENRASVRRALRRCRASFAAIEVDRLQVKPVVCVIGEIWAMTTEGDGNYQIQHFLEQEGAEVVIQPLFNWLFYLLWDMQHEVDQRRDLRIADASGRGLAGRSPLRLMLATRLTKVALAAMVRAFAHAGGLGEAHVPDIAAMARATHRFYDSKVRGGEAFMEVGKFIDAAKERHAHLVVSIKPFGCLPSSGVSDGVQSLVNTLFPDTAFYALETTGDGIGSVYSRLQMMLFNAHKRAKADFDAALAGVGLDEQTLHDRLRDDATRNNALYSPPRHYPTTAANLARACG